MNTVPMCVERPAREVGESMHLGEVRMSVLDVPGGGQVVVVLARDVSTPRICDAVRSLRPGAMLRRFGLDLGGLD
jgi:hypothetical protein